MPDSYGVSAHRGSVCLSPLSSLPGLEQGCRNLDYLVASRLRPWSALQGLWAWDLVLALTSVS